MLTGLGRYYPLGNFLEEFFGSHIWLELQEKSFDLRLFCTDLTSNLNSLVNRGVF